jgi:hypothetical protein
MASPFGGLLDSQMQGSQQLNDGCSTYWQSLDEENRAVKAGFLGAERPIVDIKSQRWHLGQ